LTLTTRTLERNYSLRQEERELLLLFLQTIVLCLSGLSETNKRQTILKEMQNNPDVSKSIAVVAEFIFQKVCFEKENKEK